MAGLRIPKSTCNNYYIFQYINLEYYNSKKRYRTNSRLDIDKKNLQYNSRLNICHFAAQKCPVRNLHSDSKFGRSKCIFRTQHPRTRVCVVSKHTYWKDERECIMNGRLPDDIICNARSTVWRRVTVENDNGNNNTDDNNNGRRVFVYTRNNIIVSDRYNVNNGESLTAERDALL